VDPGHGGSFPEPPERPVLLETDGPLGRPGPGLSDYSPSGVEGGRRGTGPGGGIFGGSASGQLGWYGDNDYIKVSMDYKF